MQPAVAMAGKPGPVRTGGRAQSHFGFYLLETVVLLLFCCNLKLACAQDVAPTPTQFVLHDITASTISCIGTSSVTSTDDAISLTAPDRSDGTVRVSGGCFYSNSIHFSSDSSFSTMFSFKTSTMLDSDEGTYLSFFISGACDSASAAATSQCLGLLGRNPYAQGQAISLPLLNQSIVVELNLLYARAAVPQQEIVSFSISDKQGIVDGGSFSSRYGPLPAKGQFDKTYVWIDYDGQTQRIGVSMTLEPKKPCFPQSTAWREHLSEAINNSQSVMGFFTSSAPESNALTKVYDWSFNASGPAEDIFEGQAKCLDAAEKRLKLIEKIVFPVLGIALLGGIVAAIVIRYRRANRQSHEYASLVGSEEPLVSEA